MEALGKEREMEASKYYTIRNPHDFENEPR